MDTETKDRSEHPAGWKGNCKQDYLDAQEAGSIRAAANRLGVSRSTVRRQWARYGVVNPETGEVPGR